MTCVHHWLCGTVTGGETPAQCRDCGAVRVFKSAYFDSSLHAGASNVYLKRKRL